MFTKRTFVTYGILTIGFGMSCTCQARSSRVDSSRGCWLQESEAQSIYPEGTDTRLFATGNEPMIPRSGDRDFDYALAQTLAKISDLFGVLPGFAYYDDYDGKNAYATSAVRLNRADGTVLFGQQFLAQLRANPDHPELNVAAICAHEFGHILQYKHNLQSKILVGQSTVKRAELQADYFAGYFAGIRKKERPSFPAAVFASTQHAAGDNMINHRDHHGTPDERAAAVVKGFHAGYTNKRTLSEAIQESINYVITL